MKFFVAFIFAMFQVLLTTQMFFMAKIKKHANAFMFFALKFVLYGLGIAIVVRKYLWQITEFLYGYVAGVPITVILFAVYMLLKNNNIDYKVIIKFILEKSRQFYNFVKPYVLKYWGILKNKITKK